MSITTIVSISDNSLERIYRKALATILIMGSDIVFGDKDEIKKARECHFTIQVYGKAIKDLIKGNVPKKCSFQASKIKEFQKSFTDAAVNPYGFVYSYPQLLREYPRTNYEPDCGPSDKWADYWDQMKMSVDLLLRDVNDNISSNRNVGVLYHPYMKDMQDKPCFNWFQVRYNGDRKVSLRFLFRSHDYVDALIPNLCALAYAFDELVVKPAGCTIEEIIVTSTSGHAYEHSSQDVLNIVDLPGVTWKDTHALNQVFNRG